MHYQSPVEPTAEATKGAPRLFGGFGIGHARGRAVLLVGSIVLLAQAPYTYQIYLAVHVTRP